MLPANLEGAVPMEYMRHQGKIMVPWQKQEGTNQLKCFPAQTSSCALNISKGMNQ